MKRSLALVLAVVNVALVAIAAVAVTLAAERVDFMTTNPLVLSRGVQAVHLVALATLVAAPLLILVLAAFELAWGVRRPALAAAALAGAVLLVPTMWLLAGDRIAARAEARVEREWAQALEPMDAFLARYPDAPTSDAALALEAAAVRVGIEMTPFDDKGPHPDAARAAAYKAIERKLHAYLSPPDGSPFADGPPPPEVAEWITARREDLLSLVTTVRTRGPIAYKTAWGAADAPLAPVHGLRQASAGTILLALDRASAGDTKAAADALDVAWLIGAGVRDRGDFLSQLVSHQVDRRTLAAVRRIGGADGWSDRLEGLNYRRSVLSGLQGDAWHARVHARAQRSIVYGPLMRLMAVDNGDALQSMVTELSRGDPCALDASAINARAESSLIPWNVIYRMALPSVTRGWATAVTADLEVELTRKVLEARSSGDRWPDTLAGLESGVCPGRSWRYAKDENGVSLTLDPGRQVGRTVTFSAH